MVPIALLPPDRARLHAAIAARFDAMLAAGLVDELRGLRQRFELTPGPAVDALRRLSAGVGISRRRDRLRDALRAKGISATRQLAKRQFTWLRARRRRRSIADRRPRDTVATSSRARALRTAGPALTARSRRVSAGAMPSR